MTANYRIPMDPAYWVASDSTHEKASIRVLPPELTEIVSELSPSLRPFEDRKRLLDHLLPPQITNTEDLINLPGERAKVQYGQMQILLEHLSARHAISYEIGKRIDYESSSVRSKFYEIQHWSPVPGYWSELQSGLIKQLQSLDKERWAETVACWRDTGRLLTSLLEQGAEHADQTRKARLLEDDL